VQLRTKGLKAVRGTHTWLSHRRTSGLTLYTPHTSPRFHFPCNAARPPRGTSTAHPQRLPRLPPSITIRTMIAVFECERSICYPTMYASTQPPHVDQLVERLVNLIKSGQSEPYVEIPNIPTRLFEDCRTRLLNHLDSHIASDFDSKLFYQYDANLERLTISCESRSHERVKDVLWHIGEVVRQWVAPRKWELSKCSSPCKY
jgi:hypothetical protein